MKKRFVLTAAVILLTTGAVFAASNYKYSSAPAGTNAQTPLKGSVVTIPAGQTFEVTTTMPLSSETLTKGQSVSLALSSGFYYGGSLIASPGSSVNGMVIDVSKAKRGSMNGKLLIRFNMIVTPYGAQIPVSAVIKTDDNSGMLIGGTKMDVAKAYTKDVAVGAGVGAVAGVAVSALSGGSLGKGTALATAAGAAGGVAKSVWDKGNDVIIPVNSCVELVLTQPVAVNPSSYNYW